MCIKLMIMLVFLPSISSQNCKSSDLVKTLISISIANFRNMIQDIEMQLKIDFKLIHIKLHHNKYSWLILKEKKNFPEATVSKFC